MTIDTAKLAAYLMDRFADVVTCGVMNDCLEECMGRQHVHAAVTAGLAFALATGGVPTAAIADTLGIKADSASEPGSATWKEGHLKSPGKTDALGTESLHMGFLGQQTVQGGVPDASADKSTPDPMVDEVEADLPSTLAPSASIDKAMKLEGRRPSHL